MGIGAALIALTFKPFAQHTGEKSPAINPL
jgi:hypothetical protein